jgi:Bacterial Ig-like domain/PKD domain
MRTWCVQASCSGAGCRRRRESPAGRRLFLAIAASLGAFALSPAAVAIAEPTLTINSPGAGNTEEQTPSFSGSTSDHFFDQVIVNLYVGTGASPPPVQTPSALPDLFGAWKTGAVSPLRDGQYTAVAEETNGSNETGFSNPVTFTVDTPPPQVAVTSPVSGSSTNSGAQQVSGVASTASRDLPAVTIKLFAGTTVGSPLETLVVEASANGSWSTTFGGLGPGTYTAQAEQRDVAGNSGVSAPVTFTVTPPPPPPAPVASFKWFPAAPQVGEPVSLLSTSTDTSSPITTFAWSLASSGAFTAGKPVLTTSFSTAGNHVVRLQVTDANGLSSTATETIPVAASPLPLLLPVPIVRIAGYETSSGVNISVLSVQAPVTARVTVTCRGHGCPTKSVSVLARASKKKSKAASVQIAFRRFERSLPAGVILEIRVSKPGQIGKYTRFVIRRHLLPVRVDDCLASSNPQPIACPS